MVLRGILVLAEDRVVGTSPSLPVFAEFLVFLAGSLALLLPWEDLAMVKLVSLWVVFVRMHTSRRSTSFARLRAILIEGMIDNVILRKGGVLRSRNLDEIIRETRPRFKQDVEKMIGKKRARGDDDKGAISHN